MLPIIVFLSLILCSSAYKTNNIFTIQHYNQSLDQILSYSYDKINNYKLDIDHRMNMYSKFTYSYFKKCHLFKDGNCNYDIKDQEIACKIYMRDHESKNESYVNRNIYYYGVYNDYYHNYIINNDGSTYEINKQERLYKTLGIYIIEDLIPIEFNIDFKLLSYTTEPDDFYSQMMLYLIPYENRTIFCPYWIPKEF